MPLKVNGTVTRLPLIAESRTENFMSSKTGLPSVFSKTSADTAVTETVGSGSSSVMTPLARRLGLAPAKLALTAEESSRISASLSSLRLSSLTAALTVLRVWPGAKVSVPGVKAT